jgi:PBSX family phage terminase large subunit
MAIECPIYTPEGRLYNPLPAQAAFHRSPALNKAYIGGFGSGRTLCGAIETFLLCTEFPDLRGEQFLICRYDYDALKDTTWKTFLEIIPDPIRRQCHITKSPLSCMLPNGLEVMGKNLKDHKQKTGYKLAGAWFDECNEEGVAEEMFLQVRGRMRSTKGPGVVLLTGNPGGRNWVYQRFFAYKMDPNAKRYDSHDAFHAGTEENLYLPESYLAQMRETYPEDWLEKYFAGSFDVFEGQILDTFRPDIHLVNEFRIPGEWPRYRAVDHGLTAPTACTWHASDFEGNVITYNEYYQRCAIPEENAKNILSMSASEEDLIRWTVIDPATQGLNAAAGVAESIISQYRRGGLFCRPGNNDVKASIAKMRMLLAPDPEHRFPAWHPNAGDLGSPRWFIFKGLRHLTWEMQQWKWRDVKPGAVDREKVLEKDDHLIATVRYFFMESPQSASPVKELTTTERFERIVADLFPEQREADGLIGHDRLRN